MADKIMKIGNGSSSVDFFVPNGNITAGKDEDGRTVATVNIEATGYVVGANIKNKGSNSQPIYFDADGVAQPCGPLTPDLTGVVRKTDLANKGSTSQPIYFDGDGNPQVCTDIETGPTGNFVEVEGDVMEGALEMFSTALTTKTGRNIQAGTEALTAGTSPLPTGDIYIQYI